MQRYEIQLVVWALDGRGDVYFQFEEHGLPFVVFESFGQSLESLPELAHGLVGHQIARQAVDQVVLLIAEIPQERFRMPDRLIQQLRHPRYHHRLPSLPLILLKYSQMMHSNHFILEKFIFISVKRIQKTKRSRKFIRKRS